MNTALPCPFKHKPLLVGGQAMAYYGLRDAGMDYDLVVHPGDFELLRLVYASERGAYGDERIRLGAFELYDAFFGLTYDLLSHHAVEHGDYLIASLPALLYIAASMPSGNGRQDAEVLMKKIGGEDERHE